MRLSPGDTVGILGGGQLGRMLCLAAARLGLDTHVYCPDPDSPAFAVATDRTVAAYEDAAALCAFAAACAVVTYEFENVPWEALEPIAARVRPPRIALLMSRGRLTEKAFLRDAGLVVAPHAAVDTVERLATAVEALGPGILKADRFGYDGKGQVRVAPGDDLAAAFAAIGGVRSVYEALVPFVAETSTVLVRAADGTTLAYEPPLNEHAGGILRRSTLPGPLPPALAAQAAAWTAAVAKGLSYVGVLTIEWFVTGDPERPLIANEMAPRVHNSGHWTEDAAVTSQFENHVRAIAGWPLGSTARTHDVTMENVIGAEANDWARHLETPTARLHLYGKRHARPGRKMGHVNHLASPAALRPVDFPPAG